MSNRETNIVRPAITRLSFRKRASGDRLSRSRAREVFEEPVGYLRDLGLDVEVLSCSTDPLAPAA